jgi:uncharacterized DUF497 family protein
VEFEWDEAKHAKMLRDRGIGFDDGARIFAGPVLIWEDARRECGEDRFRAVGETDGNILYVVFRGAGMRSALSRFGEPIGGRPSYGYD